jgi:Domain of unknown function (DUF4760)
MDKISFDLTLRHRALLAVLILSVLAAFGYAWANAWRVSLDDIVKILALGVGTATAIYAAMTLNLIYAAHQETVRLKQKEFSARLMERWLDEKMIQKLQAIDPFIKEVERLTEVEVTDRLTADAHQRHACLSLLNFFEEMATEIKCGLADEAMLRDFFRGVVVTYHGKLRRVVAARRTDRNNPRIYTSLETLANKWGTGE